MSHVLSREKREQVIALGRLGWSLRRIEQATGVQRDSNPDGRPPARGSSVEILGHSLYAANSL
jgi:hypothetical protein